MPALEDLLDPAARQRLAALGSPPPNEDLAASARAAAAESAETGRIAWGAVVLVLDKTQTPEEARTMLAGMIADQQLRATALGCLAALTSDSTTAEAQ